MRIRPLPFVALVSTVAACSSTRDQGGHAAGSGGATTSGHGTGSNGTPASNTSNGSTASGAGGAGSVVTYEQPVTDGVFNLGPVDYTESVFHNACAPGTKYDPRVQQAEGLLLAGMWDGVPDVASYCDACIWVTTGKGKFAMLRVVTYGQTTTDSIDVSPEAFQILDTGEYPRTMTWQLAECPDTGPMMYEFQTQASEWWTSLWVRNARVPLAKVEVQSKNHASWSALTRGSDGTLTDDGGFGAGSFSIKSTGVDGQEVVETFDWPSGGIGGVFVTGKANFH